MQAEEIVRQLDEGTVLEGPHFGEPVRVLLAKARGERIEVVAEGVNTKQTWKKLLRAEDFDSAVKITSAGGLATLTGDARQFRLAAEAHRIRLAYQYDPHFAVSEWASSGWRRRSPPSDGWFPLGRRQPFGSG